MTIVVRTRSADPGATVPEVRRILAEFDSGIALEDAETMSSVLDRCMSQTGFLSVLVTATAGTALILALVGPYGVVSYLIAKHTDEVGVRMAIAATPAKVRRMMVAGTLKLVAVGLSVGLIGSPGAGAAPLRRDPREPRGLCGGHLGPDPGHDRNGLGRIQSRSADHADARPAGRMIAARYSPESPTSLRPVARDKLRHYDHKCDTPSAETRTLQPFAASTAPVCRLARTLGCHLVQLRCQARPMNERAQPEEKPSDRRALRVSAACLPPPRPGEPKAAA